MGSGARARFCYHFAMQEPSLRTSRLAIAGGIAAVIAVGGAGFFLGRSTAPDPGPSDPVVAETPAPQPSPSPEPVRVLGRADIIALANEATDALVAGEPVPAAVHDAVDRRFELAVPFGCGGAAGEDSAAPLRWRYDSEEEALRLHVATTSWSAADWGLAEAAPAEAIEGFWIARPWSSSGDCPQRAGQARASGMEPVTIPGQTLAVAQFFADDTRRAALRDGRPFESVQRVPREDFAAPRGFRLLLSGRIDSLPGGGPVRCIQPAGIEQRPICVVAVTLDEVRIENPATDDLLARWPIGDD